MHMPCSLWTNHAIFLLPSTSALLSTTPLPLHSPTPMPLRPSPLASLKQPNTSNSVVCSNRLRFPSRLTIFATTVFLGRTLKYSSILNYLDGLRWLHVMFDLPPPPLSHCRVQLTLRGLKRLLSASVQRKLPITPNILLALRDVMDLSLPLHRALWAAFLLGFFTFFSKVKHYSPKSFAVIPRRLQVNWAPQLLPPDYDGPHPLLLFEHFPLFRMCWRVGFRN